MTKLSLLVSVVLLVLLVFAGCAQPAPTQPAPTTPSATPQAPPKTIELKFASPSSPVHVLNTDVNQPWIKKVEEQAKGQVKITFYPGGALGKSTETYELAQKKIADISYGWIGYYPGRFKLTEVYMLPGMVNNPKEAYTIYDAFNETLKTEWKDVKVLWMGVAMRYDIFTVNKQVKTCEDVKGLKLVINSEMAADGVKVLGGVPVEVSAQEAYVTLQRGVADGIVNPWSSLLANKQGEVTKYFTKVGLMQSVWFAIMNMDSYNSLPADIKKIIDDNTGRAMWQSATDAYWNFDVAAEPKMIEQSNNTGVIYQFPSSELAKYRALAKPIYDKWLDETKQKGLPAQETLDLINKKLGR